MKPFVLLLAATILCRAYAAGTPQRVLHARDYGIHADGKTLETDHLQRALDDAAARNLPLELEPGQYLTGALFLKSHTHLILPRGAELLASTWQQDYPPVFTRAAGIEMEWPAALLNIDGQQDVAIEGEGTIDGRGKGWWDAFWSRVPAYEERGLRWAVDYDVQRPELIRIFRSSQVRIGGGLLLRRSAFWTVHICYSSQVSVRGLTIRDNDPLDGLGPSTDGIDIDSSQHVLVEDVDIANNDDAICLKAGMNADGIRVNRPTEDVTIRNAIVREGISAIAIGSDTAGGFRNVQVEGVRILSGVRYGIYLKSTHTRGGWTDNLQMRRISMEGVKTAIKIDLDYFPAFSTPRIPPGIEKNLPPGLRAIPDYWHTLAAPVDPVRGLPHFRHVLLEDVQARGVGTAIEANAASHAPLEDFVLRNIHMEAQRAGSVRHTQRWQLDNVTIRAAEHTPLLQEDMLATTGKFTVTQ